MDKFKIMGKIFVEMATIGLTALAAIATAQIPNLGGTELLFGVVYGAYVSKHIKNLVKKIPGLQQ